jgi:hypothetical protein
MAWPRADWKGDCKSGIGIGEAITENGFVRRYISVKPGLIDIMVLPKNDVESSPYCLGWVGGSHDHILNTHMLALPTFNVL